MQTKAIIIGGGIGGLTAAIALQRVGIDVTVLEQAEELRNSIRTKARQPRCRCLIGCDFARPQEGRIKVAGMRIDKRAIKFSGVGKMDQETGK